MYDYAPQSKDVNAPTGRLAFQPQPTRCDATRKHVLEKSHGFRPTRTKHPTRRGSTPSIHYDVVIHHHTLVIDGRVRPRPIRFDDLRHVRLFFSPTTFTLVLGHCHSQSESKGDILKICVIFDYSSTPKSTDELNDTEDRYLRCEVLLTCEKKGKWMQEMDERL